MLVLSATPQVGVVPGSADLVARYERAHGPVNNYAVNSYESMRAVLQAIAAASTVTRDAVAQELRRLNLPSAAHPRPTTFDDKGDNDASLTALHTARHGRFHQVALID